jgi:mRNA interferase RelE/StbE
MLSLKDFDIIWLKTAHKSFSLMLPKEQQKLSLKIDALVNNQESLNIKKLKGFTDLFRIAIGNYRIIYKVDAPNKRIIISAVGHRKDVYRFLTTFAKLLAFS